MIGMNSTDMVIMDMLTDMFEHYKKRQNHDSSDENMNGVIAPEN